MPHLKDLHLGSLAAESDDELFNYFVVTPIAETLIRQNIGLVLGRKGSGKTALFRQAEELLHRFGHDHVNVVRLNMDDHAWAAFRDFTNLGLSREHAATVSWQLALLLQLTVAMVSESSIGWSNKSIVDLNDLHRFVEDNFGDSSPDLAKSARLFGQFGGLKVGAFGVGFEANFDRKAEPRQLVPALTDAISQRLVHPLHDSAWLLVLDQLDESWDGSDEKKDLLVGLVKGVKRLNDDFGWRGGDPIGGARAIAFLRTDIYQALEFDDKDKLRDTVLEISWTHEQLRDMLQQRLSDLNLDDLFEQKTAQRKGRIPKGSFNYLVSRTFMRPRDLLQFLRVIQTTEPDAERINKRTVERSEPAYSRDKVDDLRQEYRRGAPWVNVALDALKQGPNKFDSRVELEKRLSERLAESALDNLRMTIPELVEWMTETSILGAAPRRVQTETIQFRCEGGPVSLEGESTAWVHPALFLGLALSEPRTSRSASSRD